MEMNWETHVDFILFGQNNNMYDHGRTLLGIGLHLGENKTNCFIK